MNPQNFRLQLHTVFREIIQQQETQLLNFDIQRETNGQTFEDIDLSRGQIKNVTATCFETKYLKSLKK